MVNVKQSSAQRLKMAERAKLQLDLHFKDVPEAFLWDRKKNHGWSTIPRSLPIVMQAADLVSKGTPPGHTLFCLWTRAPDNSVVVIESPSTFAAEAGFQGERAVDTWRKRMKRLRDLQLIQSKPGPSGEFHYVLLVSPTAAMEMMRARGQVNDGVYARFIDRLSEIGAYGDIEAVQKYWRDLAAAQASAVGEAPSGSAPAAPAEVS